MRNLNLDFALIVKLNNYLPSNLQNVTKHAVPCGIL